MNIDKEMEIVDFFFKHVNNNNKYFREKLNNFISIDLLVFSLISTILLSSDDLNPILQRNLLFLVIMMILCLIPKISLVALRLHSFYPKITKSFKTFEEIEEKEENVDEKVKEELKKLKHRSALYTEEYYSISMKFLNKSILTSCLFIISFIMLLISTNSVFFWIMFAFFLLLVIYNTITYRIKYIKFRLNFCKKNNPLESKKKWEIIKWYYRCLFIDE